MACTPGPTGLKPLRVDAQHQALTQLLPKAGLSSPITEIVLPHTFTGTCTGTWIVVAREHTGAPDSGTLRARVGDGHARTREHQTASDSRSSDDLLDHYSS